MSILSPVIILKTIKNSGPKISQVMKKTNEFPIVNTSLLKHKHPKISDMVNSAIKNLNEEGGSSLHAIKKYIAGTFRIDAKIQATLIKKYLKTALISGYLTQTTGNGISGSFKMSTMEIQTPKMKVKRVKRSKVSELKRKRLIKLMGKKTITTPTILSKPVKIFGNPNTKLVAPIKIIKIGPKMNFILKK